MNTPQPADPATEANSAIRTILADMSGLASTDRRGIVVDSPPGAGKTTLVVAAAITLADSGEQCMIVAQTNTQIDDLVLRLATNAPNLRIGRLSATGYTTPRRILALNNAVIATSVDDLLDVDIVLATAAKWATVKDHRRPWAIVDFDITLVVHPLSGRRDATAFHLETGRLCVLTSRHRHACIVIARADITDLLDAHPSTEPVHLGVSATFPDGWEANQAILAHLANHRVRA